jgi:hypothetical protein
MTHSQVVSNFKFSPTRKENQMSVSLREGIVEILVSNDMCVSIADDKDGVADQILALFPPQLTEEDFPKKLTHSLAPGSQFDTAFMNGYNKAIDNCKASLIGKCGGGLSEELEKAGVHICLKCGQPFLSIGVELCQGHIVECEHIFEKANNTSLNGDYICSKCGIVGNRTDKRPITADKLATPTFSGGEKIDGVDLENHWCRNETIRPYPQVLCSCCNPRHYPKTNGIAPIIPRDKHTEQKEKKEPFVWCKCVEPIEPPHGVIGNKCRRCGLPIPAEKKDYDCLLCIYHGVCMSEGSPKGKCATYKAKPEPKPKDRIEPLGFFEPKHETLYKKVDEIIHAFNSQGER